MPTQPPTRARSYRHTGGPRRLTASYLATMVAGKSSKASAYAESLIAELPVEERAGVRRHFNALVRERRDYREMRKVASVIALRSTSQQLLGRLQPGTHPPPANHHHSPHGLSRQLVAGIARRP